MCCITILFALSIKKKDWKNEKPCEIKFDYLLSPNYVCLKKKDWKSVEILYFENRGNSVRNFTESAKSDLCWK